jgi:hypothetical protein
LINMDLPSSTVYRVLIMNVSSQGVLFHKAPKPTAHS